MSCELFDSGGGHNNYKVRYGRLWSDRPVVVIKENGILCNELFVSTFSLKDKETINVFFDSKRKRIGFQRPTDDLSAKAGYRAQAYGKYIMISCKKVAKKFPDVLEKAHSASLNSSDRIIEVQLS